MLNPQVVKTLGSLQGYAHSMETNFQVELKHGDRRSALELFGDEAALLQLQNICTSIGLITARWIASGWSGGPNVPLTRVNARIQDRKFHLRVGRYKGFLVDMSDKEGQPVTPQKAWERWMQLLPNKPQKEKSVTPVVRTIAPVQEPEVTHVSVHTTPETIAEVLKLGYAKRNVDECVEKDKLVECISNYFSPGKPHLVAKKAAGKMIGVMERRHLIAKLSKDQYGFEDEAMEIIEGGKKEIEPQKPAIVLEASKSIPIQVTRELVPQAPRNMIPLNNQAKPKEKTLKDQLAELLLAKKDLDLLSREDSRLKARLGDIRSNITKLNDSIITLERQLQGYKDEERALQQKEKEIESKLHDLREVEETMLMLEQLRK